MPDARVYARVVYSELAGKRADDRSHALPELALTAGPPTNKFKALCLHGAYSNKSITEMQVKNALNLERAGAECDCVDALFAASPFSNSLKYGSEGAIRGCQHLPTGNAVWLTCSWAGKRAGSAYLRSNEGGA